FGFCRNGGARRGNVVVRSIASSVEAGDLISRKDESNLADDDSLVEGNDDLRNRIFRERLPKRSVSNVLQKWIDEGRRIEASDLRSISRDLRRSQRYKHALEISEWMVSHEEYHLSSSDYAIRIDLMAKVFGTSAAERYFEALPSSAKTNETYTALLHCYASLKQVENAEALFERIEPLPSSAITYNELMTLYVSADQPEKVPAIVHQMKQNNVAPDLFTYNLWVTSSATLSNSTDEVNRILDQMGSDEGRNESWIRYIKMVKAYLFAVGTMKSSRREAVAYEFLVMMYGAMEEKRKVDGVWKCMSGMGGNYASAVVSYLMLGDCDDEVAGIVEQWRRRNGGSEFDSSMWDKLVGGLESVGFGDEA
ncbi:hypothetical protein M569_06760, partial [Genlisea aurea]